MRKEEFYVLNSLYNGSIGRAGCTYDVEETKALNDTDIYNKLVKTGYIEKESGSITKTGLEALEPYRVNNAVILAAGFVSVSTPLVIDTGSAVFNLQTDVFDSIVPGLLPFLTVAGVYVMLDKIKRNYTLAVFIILAVSLILGGLGIIV